MTEIAVSFNTLRCNEILDMKANGLNPYPHKFNVTSTISSFVNNYTDKFKIFDELIEAELIYKNSETKQLTRSEQTDLYIMPVNAFLSDMSETLMGRVMLLRAAGKKLIFLTVMGDGVTVQFLINSAYYKNDESSSFADLLKTIKRGDIVCGIGHPGRSKTGELSVYVTKLVRCTPSLHELPTSHFGIQDNELRARNRFLDLIVNPSSRKPFIIKSTVIKLIRQYLDKKSFLEVHTPILSGQAGGANAKPFQSYHNDLKMDMFLRIAPELFLKQLIVGGFDRVYEIGPQFRNESIDDSHNPEFISLEFYMTGVDYTDLMFMCEELMSDIVYTLKGSYKFKFTPHDTNVETEVNFTPPFKRLDLTKEVEKGIGCALPNDFSSEETRLFLIEQCNKFNVDCRPPQTIARLFDKLAGKFVESQCVNPTFVINHPLIMSPLAKWHRENPQLTERFELFVLGTEYANAYTELNDPFIQKETFSKQMDDKKNGDDEAQEIDHTFIKALEYGLPPTGGFGMGIDRFAMLLSNVNNIRDVILFPTLRGDKQN